MVAATRSLWLYSSDGRLGLCISADNRLRLYDVAAGCVRQQFVDKDHFAFRYTCMAWTQSASWHDKKVVVNAKAGGGLGLVALGTDKGGVRIWDLTRGVVAAKLGESQSLKPVTGVAFSANGAQVYTCSSEADVLEWDIKSKECKRKLAGDKHGSSALCLHGATNMLAVGRTKLYLIDLSTGDKVGKFSSGHASSVSALAFSQDGRFLVSASHGLRFVNVFDCNGTSRAAVVSIALEDCPVALDVYAAASQPDLVSLTILVCGDTGGVRVIRQAIATDQAAHEQAEAQGQRMTTTPAGSSSVALTGKLAPADPSVACSLILGSDASPTILQSIKYAKGPAVEDLLPSLALPGGGGDKKKQSSEASTGKKRKRAEDAKEIGAGKPGYQKVATDSLQDDAERGTLVSTNGGAAITTNTEKEQDDDGKEPTIGKKLMEMVAAGEGGVGSGAGGKGSRGLSNGKKATTPKTGSLVTVLSQAIKSSDDDLLEQCLQSHGSEVISTTVRLVPPHLILALLDTLAKKLERRPQRAAELAPWIRAVLEDHAAYLMSQSSLSSRLGAIYHLASRRVAALPKLLSLSGRLDLMLAQISKHTGVRSLQQKGKTVLYLDA